MKEFSIILPAYNEEKNITKSVELSRDFFKKIFRNFEILVVNDGSKDQTGKILRDLAKKIPELRIITHRKNLGYGKTVWDGLRAGQGKLLFFTDSDLQFDIRQAKSFIKEIKKNDVVLGYRKKRSEGISRWLNAKGWRVIAYILLGIKIRDIDCAFKLFKKEVIDSIEIKSAGATFSAELLYKIDQKGYRVLELPVDHFKREFGSPTGAKLSVIIKSFSEIYSFYQSQPNLVKTRSAFAYVLAIITLFLSRIVFMSNSADFFDSTQYLWRTADSSWLRAITTGHAPYHPLYIFFSNLFFRWHLGSEMLCATLPSVIFGSLSIITLFIILKKVFSPKIAWIATTIYAFLPFIWISQITILVDPTEHFFFYLSVLLIILAWNKRWLWFCLLAVLSGLSLSLAALAHTQVGFWVLAYPGIILLLKPKFNRETLLKVVVGSGLVGIFALSAILIYAKLLLFGETLTPLGLHTFHQALHFLIFDNISDKSSFSLSVALTRLDLLATSLVALCALGGILVMLKNERAKLLGLLIWIFPAILTASYIHENLYGRAMVLALAPISVLAANLVLKVKRVSGIIFILIILQILFVSVPAVVFYKTKEAPNESLANFEKQSEEGGVFISTNVTRTWNAYNGKFVNFGDVGVGAGETYKSALEAIANNKKAYLSSDAIYYPFWRYDGENFDFRARNIGSSSDHHTLLDEVFTKMDVTLERASKDFKQAVYRITDSADEDKYKNIENIAKDKPVIFGRIISNTKPVKNLTVNLYNDEFCLREREDLTRNDALICLMRIVNNSVSASNWSVTDKDGWFYIANEINNPKIIVAPSSSATRSDDLGVSFAQENSEELVSVGLEVFDDAKQLESAIEALEGSFFVISQNKEGKITYELNKINFTLAKTNRIEAESLGGEVGDIAVPILASNKKVRTNETGGKSKAGYMVSGPYVDLPRGKYRVDFSILARDVENQDSLVTFDVTSARTGEGFGSREVKAKDLENKFAGESIDFELKSDAKALEFRVKTDGGAEILVDYLELRESF